MSVVWRFFSLETPNSKKATCSICKVDVPRGGTTPASYNTTNLLKHLQRFHIAEYEEFVLASRQKDATTQQTLTEALQKRAKLPAESPKAKGITEKLLNFIILDDQPLSVVENVGFRSLMEHLEPRYNLPSRKYISETAIPEMYKLASKQLAAQLEDVEVMSFTTDIWTSDVSPVSLISLTVHWVNSETYALQSAVLQVKRCRGSHTSSSIAASIREMLSDWKIPLAKVHVILRDNANNMKKAMEELAVPSLGCFAHTLQLVVHEWLISQRSVNDAIANARKIVGHFKHSQLAQSRLEDVQAELNVPTNRLRQDVQTRWNSSFYMIKSLLEQKRALCAYTADHNLPVTLSVNEWAILEKTVIVLEPFEELTRNISSATSTTADVIPAITVLKRLLSNESSTDSDIKTMKSTLLQAVDRRFSNIEGNPLYSVATLLAPRYKDRYFTNEDAVEHTKAALTQEMEKMEEMLHRAKESESLATGPEEKVPRIEAAGPSRIQSSLTSLYENILEEHEEPGSESAKRTVIQMQTYLKELTIPRSDNPFEYWGNNHARFPILAATAVKFLSAPSTSVESERLFSTASNIVDEKRNRLTAEKAEMLIFLKKNIPRFLK